MIRISNIRVSAWDLGYLDVYWDFAPTYEDIGDYTLTVERSSVEFGEYVQITPPFRYKDQFRDGTVKGFHSFYTKYYYRIKAVNRVTNATAYFPAEGGATLEAPPDLAAIEMVRQYEVKLREYSGRIVWIYQKRRSGQRCSVCYDRVTSRKLSSGCKVCFDTSWVGGFHAPIERFAQVITPTEVTSKTPDTVHEVIDSAVFLGPYPELDEGDIVVEAENIRWRVGNAINKVRKARALIRQQASIHAIPKSDVEYTIPLNLSSSERRNLIVTPERNLTNPQSFDSKNVLDSLRGVFGR